MGKQVAVFTSPADEESLLAFLRSTAPVRLFLPFAASPDGLWVEGLPPFGPAAAKVFVWHTGHRWRPRVRHDEGSMAFVENARLGPVIEWGRTNLGEFLAARHPSSTVRPSRLHWPALEPYDGFGRWFAGIARWVKANGRELSRGGGQYCLPDALSQRRAARAEPGAAADPAGM